MFYKIITTVITSLILWTSSTMYSFYQVTSQTNIRAIRNEQVIKEVLVELKDLREENREILKIIIDLPRK